MWKKLIDNVNMKKYLIILLLYSFSAVGQLKPYNNARPTHTSHKTDSVAYMVYADNKGRYVRVHNARGMVLKIYVKKTDRSYFIWRKNDK